jgi:hypothetical protein
MIKPEKPKEPISPVVESDIKQDTPPPIVKTDKKQESLPIKKEVNILKNVLFELSTAKLLPQSYSELHYCPVKKNRIIITNYK